MTDFRVSLPEEEDASSEADWEQGLGRWQLSRKYYGEVAWAQGLRPAPADLEYLLEYFRIGAEVSPDVLVRLSPGELAMIHASENLVTPSVLAHLCTDCGLHWTIYRLEDGVWHAYGRSCHFTWSRGAVVEPQSDAVLSRMLEGAS